MFYFILVLYVAVAVGAFIGSSQVAAKWQKAMMLVGVLWSIFAVSWLADRFLDYSFVYYLFLLIKIIVTGLFLKELYEGWNKRD